MTVRDPDAMLRALRALGRVPGAQLLDVQDTLLTLLPREEGQKPKDVPVDQLLHKLTMMRDKLRVLEQRVNTAELGAKERVALQAHITALYNAFAGLAAFFSTDTLPTDTRLTDASNDTVSTNTGSTRAQVGE